MKIEIEMLINLGDRFPVVPSKWRNSVRWYSRWWWWRPFLLLLYSRHRWPPHRWHCMYRCRHRWCHCTESDCHRMWIVAKYSNNIHHWHYSFYYCFLIWKKIFIFNYIQIQILLQSRYVLNAPNHFHFFFFLSYLCFFSGTRVRSKYRTNARSKRKFFFIRCLLLLCLDLAHKRAHLGRRRLRMMMINH